MVELFPDETAWRELSGEYSYSQARLLTQLGWLLFMGVGFLNSEYNFNSDFGGDVSVPISVNVL